MIEYILYFLIIYILQHQRLFPKIHFSNLLSHFKPFCQKDKVDKGNKDFRKGRGRSAMIQTGACRLFVFGQRLCQCFRMSTWWCSSASAFWWLSLKNMHTVLWGSRFLFPQWSFNGECFVTAFIGWIPKTVGFT